MNAIILSKFVRYAVLTLVGLVLIVILGGGWYFSGVLEEDGLRVDNLPDEFSLVVTGIGADTITVRQPVDEDSENLGISAIWGLTDGVNYGRLGDVVSSAGDLVTRQYTPVIGGFQIGNMVRLDRSSFPPDPEQAYGLKYDEVAIPAPLGDIGAWHIGANSSTWAILVHGRASNRETSLRLLDDLERLNVHSLTIDYRNDANAPSSESGYYDFGTSEWEDVEAAVQYALGSGAEKIVLIGYSMGGGIVMSFQLNSELANRTVGMILDAPMLNFGRTVDKGAEERSVPVPITFAAKVISSMRFGIDWTALDFLAQADAIDIPVLLIHGDADDTVPIETSIEFAAAAPDRVMMHTFEGAGHVASWNMYPDEYESLFKEFVGRVR